MDMLALADALDDLPRLMRLAREASGYDRTELARLAGVDPASLARYEEGLYAPRPERLRRIAHALAAPKRRRTL